ncbi:hypothetical protein ACLB2K_054236 [Fragaria x ananassa]
MEEFAIWRSSVLALHKCIVSLVTILGLCLQLEFANASAIVKDCRRTILMKLFITDISLYFGLLSVMILQINQSNRDFGEFMNKIGVLLGTLASILELLILLPPFGWLTLFFWSMYLMITAIGSYQLSKTLCKRAVAALILALGEFQMKLISLNGRLMGSVAGLGRASEKLKDLIKRSRYSTEHDETSNLSKELPV